MIWLLALVAHGLPDPTKRMQEQVEALVSRVDRLQSRRNLFLGTFCDQFTTKSDCDATDGLAASCTWSDDQNKCMYNWGKVLNEGCADGVQDQVKYTCTGDYVVQYSWSDTTAFTCDLATGAKLATKMNMHKGKCGQLFGGKFHCENGKILVQACETGETEVGIWEMIASMMSPLKSTCEQETDEDTGALLDSSMMMSCSDYGMVMNSFMGSGTCDSTFNMAATYSLGCTGWPFDMGEIIGMKLGCNDDFMIYEMCDAGSSQVDPDAAWDALSKVSMAIPSDCMQVTDSSGTQGYINAACSNADGTGHVTQYGPTDSTCSGTAVSLDDNPDAFIGTFSVNTAKVKKQQFGTDKILLGAKCRTEGTQEYIDFWPATAWKPKTSSLKRSGSSEEYVPAKDLTENSDGTFSKDGVNVKIVMNSDRTANTKYSDDPGAAAAKNMNKVNSPFKSDDTSGTKMLSLFFVAIAVWFSF